jgi:hypothetical protein
VSRRLTELRARQRLLLTQCALERAQLGERLGELKASPLARAAAEMLVPGGEGRALPLLRPLTWAAALAGLLLLRRPRQVLMLLGYARTAISFGSRAALALRLLDQFRARSRERGDSGP